MFRTPLLPVDELERWAEGIEVPGTADAGDDELAAAAAADRRRLRERLALLLERPEITEAVFVASPSLHDEGIAAWRKDPDSKSGLRAERALVRYLARMASRATPFGLFSGCSVGRVDETEATRLELASSVTYRRHTRLDMDYLFALCEELSGGEELRAELLYRPSSSLYRAAGRWRYAEARLDGKQRTYHLVAVEPTPYLDDTLERARGGATVDELARALVADLEGEVSLEEAREYVFELIESQILLPELAPRVTGESAVSELADLFAAYPAGETAARVLTGARQALARLDDEGLGHSAERYREVADRLSESLPTEVEISRLFQVDMVKPAGEAVLGGEVLSEITRGVDLLHRLLRGMREEALDRFKQSFTERWGDRQRVPLVEVLDEETGIGFGGGGGALAEASPLVAGLPFPGRGQEESVTWGAKERELLRRVHRVVAAGEDEIELTDADVERLSGGTSGNERPPLPDAFHVMATVAAASPEALAAGDFQLLFGNAGGPSGARLLGRFCHLDPEIEAGVREHLAAEEALSPDAVFAEIVHLPQGRIGNILARPVLREHEIPYLGRSAVSEERQIPISDLSVSVVGQRIVLTSERLGREVIPRLTTAHNFVTRSLSVYRFLCALQAQGTVGGVSWSWGPLTAAPFLPRVRHGRLVLARAQWQLAGAEIEELTKHEGAALVAAARKLRRERRLPRHVELVDGDNQLAVDLENVLSLESFADVLGGRSGATLAEPFPADDRLLARGPEGRFVHEVLVPFVRRPEESAEARPAARRPADLAPIPLDLGPGSDWLYAKIYAGTSTADQALREVVGPVARQALASGAADSWFFIRYGDPEWHLRVRFHGPPERLAGEVLSRLQEAVEPWVADRRVWRFGLDTYQREVVRYGGPEGLPVAERLFWADSEAVLGIVELLEGDAGLDARWRLALRGVDTILTYLGLDLEGKIRVATRLRESYTREFNADLNLKKALGDRHRRERQALEASMDPEKDAESDLAPGFEALAMGARLAAPWVEKLQELERQGRLTLSIEDMAPSFVHMHTNRLIRSEGRAHELVLYELLFRHYMAVRSRAQKKPR